MRRYGETGGRGVTYERKRRSQGGSVRVDNGSGLMSGIGGQITPALGEVKQVKNLFLDSSEMN